MLCSRVISRFLPVVRGGTALCNGRSNLMKHGILSKESLSHEILPSCGPYSSILTKVQQWHLYTHQQYYHSTRRKLQLATSRRSSSSQTDGKKSTESTNKPSGEKAAAEVAKETKAAETGEKADAETEDTANLTIFQRFKKTYKEHGKVLVAVHVATSIVWFGSFFYIVKSGVDVVGILESWGTSEKILKPFKSSSVGEIAVAYLMYKLATPARYTVTLTGTNIAIRYLRKTGKMAQVPKNDSLRNLYKDSKSELKTTSDKYRHRRKSKKRRKKDAEKKQSS